VARNLVPGKAKRRVSASRTAAAACTTPQPCRSTGTWGSRFAESIRMRFTWCGCSEGFASSMQATMLETMGAAKEVPSTCL
jgi:hypothetical protein